MATTATYDSHTGVLAARVGVPFHHTIGVELVVSAGAEDWAWTLNGTEMARSSAGVAFPGLPPGLLVLPVGPVSVTGTQERHLVILGKPSAPGLYRVALSGSSVVNTLEVIVAVEADCPSGSGGSSSGAFDDPAAAVLDVDLVPCTVSGQLLAEADEDAAPVLYAKRGDTFPVILRFNRSGVPVDWPALQTVTLGVKEFEGETLYALSDGTFEGGEQAVVITVEIDASTMSAVLSSYEGDRVTSVDVVAEIQFTATGGTKRTTRSFLIRIERDLYV